MLKYLPFFAIAVTFFLTNSRAGLVSLSFTIFILFVSIIRKSYLAEDKEKQKIFFQILFVLFFAFLLGHLMNQTIIGEGGREFNVSDRGAAARFVFWMAAILIFFDYPWLGVGLGNYELYLPKYTEKAHDLLGFVQFEAVGYTKWAHNELLQLACEGGFFVFTIILLILFWYLWQLNAWLRGRRQWSSLKLYSYIFLLPFIVQSMFSWPLRHPAIMVLFFTFLGLLISQHRYRTIQVSPGAKGLIRAAAFCGVMVLLLLSYHQAKMRAFVEGIDQEDPQTRFPLFEQLARTPYLEQPLLNNMVPRYTRVALRDDDKSFGEQILPYAEKIASLQGGHWQWFNLGLIYHLLAREEEAKQAVRRAIDLKPSEGKYWEFEHYLNMLRASKQTGRPLKEFLPIPPDGGASDVKEVFELHD